MKTLCAAVLMLTLSQSFAQTPPPPPPALTPAQTPTTGSAIQSFEVTGNQQRITHACTDNEHVKISGMGHVVTLTGQCGLLEVNGASSKVTTDTASRIVVSGMKNSVIYKSGTPNVSVTGVASSAEKAK